MVAAALGLVVALASQSIGAIRLLCVGLFFCWAVGFRLMRQLSLLGLLLILSGGAMYLTGKVPLREFAENTAIGHKVVGLARFSGRGSLIWRIARDQSALKLIREHPIAGTARWDWWRQNGERPWGLWLMILGQFGFVGLLLACGTLSAPILCLFSDKRYLQHGVSVPLASIVSMAIADALLNSFLFYPAILAAGALATTDSSHRQVNYDLRSAITPLIIT